MRLALIGMSGCGKSSWSKKLAQINYKRFCCDDMITHCLETVLKDKSNGNIQELGEWMGFPHEQGYAEKEQIYLDYENRVLENIVDYLEKTPTSDDSHVVVDTTGSVIYTDEDLLKRLAKEAVIVYFKSPLMYKEELLRKYLKNRRPVLWRGHYTVKEGELPDDTLKRCYSDLLSSREDLYEKISGITIAYETLKSDGFAAPDLILEIEKRLSRGLMS